MNCQQCNTPNEYDARYCKNCGILLNYNLQPSNPYLNTNSLRVDSGIVPIEEPSLKYFYILISFDVFRTFMWLIITKVITPNLIAGESGFGDKLSLIYDVYDWSSNIILGGLIVTFAIIAKNKSAKTFLIIYGVVSLLFFLAFRFWR